VWSGRQLAGRAFSPTSTQAERQDVDGTTRLYGTAAVPTIAWHVYAGEDAAVAWASAQILTTNNILIIVGAAIAVCVAMLIVHRRITRPISRLETLVSAATTDGTFRPVPLHGPVEIAALGASFNSLMDSMDGERSQRLRLEHLRDDFIRNAAHELRTPLTTLAGLGETLALHFDILARADIDDAFAAMARQGDRARVLISNLLDLSQIEDRRSVFNIVDVAIATLVARVLEAAPPPDGTTVSVVAARDLTARADPSRLEQVVSNLLVNAYRYGGREVRVDALSEEGRMVLSVSDNGSGVEPELVDKLFEPFTRGSQANVVRGSGIGLALCRSIVQGMSGEIWYDPRLRGGSFRVSLPVMSQTTIVVKTPIPHSSLVSSN
jgi:signal transduction histidine kinase